MVKALWIIGFLALVLLYLLYENWVHRDKDDKGPKMTAPATVKSRRTAQGNYRGHAPTRYEGNTRGLWNYFVTFTLSDGEELELYVGENEFRALKEGISGQLTWQGKQFREFDTED